MTPPLAYCSGTMSGQELAGWPAPASRRRLMAGKVSDAVRDGFDGGLGRIQRTACLIAFVSSLRVNSPAT